MKQVRENEKCEASEWWHEVLFVVISSWLTSGSETLNEVMQEAVQVIKRSFKCSFNQLEELL